MEIATVILGIFGRVAEGVSAAISAAKAKNEDEAFAILEKTLSETAGDVAGLRAKLAANKAQALVDLEAKFPAAEEPTKP